VRKVWTRIPRFLYQPQERNNKNSSLKQCYCLSDNRIDLKEKSKEELIEKPTEEPREPFAA
jgi:hypothetical protein